jgi:hypothetical protein
MGGVARYSVEGAKQGLPRPENCNTDKAHYAPTFSLVVNFSKIELTP